MKLLKYEIKFNTFFKRGIKSIKDDFFICLITGYQGSGKNFFATMKVAEIPNRTIITNVHSLVIPNREIFYFTKLEDIYKYNDDKCIYLIDELSKKFPKESKQDRAFYSWLQQSRKHRRYVYMITQEYIQVPTWLRGVANKVYTTRKFLCNLFITSLGDPYLDEDTKEWMTKNYLYIIYKRTKKIANYYDTFEIINSL